MLAQPNSVCMFRVNRNGKLNTLYWNCSFVSTVCSGQSKIKRVIMVIVAEEGGGGGGVSETDKRMGWTTSNQEEIREKVRKQ